jgi:hypothetical protein
MRTTKGAEITWFCPLGLRDEVGVPVRTVSPILMAKSRHKKPENVRRYFKPSPEAISELTSLLAPGDSRR